MAGKYQVIDDSFRTDEDPELTKDLLAGKTVFVPGASNNEMNVLYGRFATRYQRKLRRRSDEINGKKGMVVWLDEAGSSGD